MSAIGSLLSPINLTQIGAIGSLSAGVATIAGGTLLAVASGTETLVHGGLATAQWETLDHAAEPAGWTWKSLKVVGLGVALCFLGTTLQIASLGLRLAKATR